MAHQHDQQKLDVDADAERNTTVSLIYDVFKAHFELSGIVFPSSKAQLSDITGEAVVAESSAYKLMLKVLLQKGKKLMEHDSKHGCIKECVQKLLSGAGLEPSFGQASFERASQEIFSGGIQWNLLLTYFVFCAELSLQADRQGAAHVEEIINWMDLFINQHLIEWIINNGGWNGLVTGLNPDADTQKPTGSKLYGLGALALAFALGFYLGKS